MDTSHQDLTGKPGAGSERFLFLLVLILAGGFVGFSFLRQGEKLPRSASPFGRGLVGEIAPELPPAGEWLNSSGPITLSSLRGKLVWIEFSFLH